MKGLTKDGVVVIVVCRSSFPSPMQLRRCFWLRGGQVLSGESLRLSNEWKDGRALVYCPKLLLRGMRRDVPSDLHDHSILSRPLHIFLIIYGGVVLGSGSILSLILLLNVHGCVLLLDNFAVEVLAGSHWKLLLSGVSLYNCQDSSFIPWVGPWSLTLRCRFISLAICFD